MITTVIVTTMLTTRDTARNPIDAKYSISVVGDSVTVAVFSTKILIELFLLPMIFPQTTVCTANEHSLASVGTSVQVAMVWLVVVGQLPQFDVRML